MFSVLVIGDPHFKVANSIDTTTMTEAVVKIAQEKKPDFIVCLGDLLDRHETIHVNPLDRATNFLWRLSQVAPTYLLVGNHDRPNNSHFLTPDHPFRAHSKWVTVVDTVLTETIGGKKFVFVPYVPINRFFEALNTTNTSLDGVEAIFTHQEFTGVQMGAITSASIESWPLENPLVINGHIHDYQWVQPNLVCVGTPYQLNFGEADNKAVSLFTWDPTPTETRLKIGVPSKKIVHLRLAEVESFEIPAEVVNYWKIVMHGNTNEMKHILRHPTIRDWIKRGVKVVHQEEKSNQEIANVIEPHVGFMTRLQQKLETKPELLQLWTEIFS